MRNLLTTTILCLTATVALSQTAGINYQAIILDPQAQELPGFNSENNPLVNKVIDLRFYIFNNEGVQEFSEYHNVITDRYGMVNLLIGSGDPFEMMEFSNIVWDGTSKTLEVYIDFNGDGEYVMLSTQILS